MYISKLREDGKVEDVRLVSQLIEGYIQIKRDGYLWKFLDGTICEQYVPEQLPSFNRVEFLTWCMDNPMKDESFTSLADVVKILAISYTSTFAMNATNEGAELYRKSAMSLGMSVMSELVISQAISMGAKIDVS